MVDVQGNAVINARLTKHNVFAYVNFTGRIPAKLKPRLRQLLKNPRFNQA
jgi:hypothetical protein